jgi:acyl-CoA thioester hydrolase
LSEAHVNYRVEISLGNRLSIGARAELQQKSSFVMVYRIERDGDVTAEGTTNLVAFDYDRRRPVRLPQEFRSAVELFEDESA